MKIVYYTDQVYLHGGIEKVLAQKLNYFSSFSNYELHLVTTEHKRKPYCYPISNIVLHHDLEINYDRSKSYFNSVNFKKVPKHIKRLKAKLDEINPDVLIVCNYAFDFYFIPFISSGIKTIKEFHSSRYYYIKELPKASVFKKLLYRINNWIENKYSHIVILNADEKKYYNSKHLEVIPNSIYKVKQKTEINRVKYIIAAGRIAPVKQFDHLIKVWSLIAKNFPDWQVHIYGGGDILLSKKLDKLIKKQEVPNIYLKGETDELSTKMQQASIYALTSATECFPMVLLESLACGLPIISYNCPHGPSNIIKNGEDGILVEPDNIHAFSQELAKLIKNEELRLKMSKSALNNMKRFDEKIIMQQWLNLFNK